MSHPQEPSPYELALARRCLADLGALLVPDYQRAAHVETLCQHLEALEAREINRLAVFMPPQHGKSTHVSQLLPSWWLGRRPTDSVVLASYAATLAESHSRRARGFLSHPSWPFPGVAIADDSAAVGLWSTGSGGSLRAVGVLGGLTGHGADLAVVDDPVKDREEADSELRREAVWTWFNEVLMTRLRPNAAVLLTMTRWHEDDLGGRVLDGPGGGEWTVLSLPALAEEDDPLGRAEGDALWPERYGTDELETRRVSQGSRSFAALYQQSPTSAEGGTFKRAWLEGRYETLPEELHVVVGVDASFGKGVGSDYSALVTVGTDGTRFFVLDTERGRWEFNTLVERIKRVAREYHPAAVLVEDAAAGQSAIQELHRESDLPVVAVKPQGSKLARAESVSPLLEAGRVLFPSVNPPWKDELVEELASFPSGKHDDQVDALVYALMRLRERGRGGAGVVGSVRSTPTGITVTRGTRTHHVGRVSPVTREIEAERKRRARTYVHPREADD
jgi:predicted phage terminase large subunit-like protein